MYKKILTRIITTAAAVCIFASLGVISAAAVDVTPMTTNTEVYNAILAELGGTLGVPSTPGTAGATVTVTGINDTLTGSVSIVLTAHNQKIIWEASTPGADIFITGNYTNASPLNFEMRGNAAIRDFIIDPSVNQGPHNITIGGNTVISGGLALYAGITVNLTDNASVDPDQITLSGGTVNRIAPSAAILVAETPAEEETETPPPEPGEEIKLIGTQPGSPPGGFPGELTVTVIDNKPFEKNGKYYFGTVDIENYFSDSPLEIPDEIFINGRRYLVGDTIYIVGEESFEVYGFAETGISYVFPAVENTKDPVKFTAENLPEGVVLSEDGVLSTESLPLVAGTYKIMVTADNGKDTHTIPVTIIIKEGYASDDELLGDLTLHDKEDEPEVLDENGEEDAENGILNLWINGELKLHYDPELEDFAGLFLDGKLLEEGKDYTTEEGSTVVVLTEQTMIPLTNGDHVVTTLFNQNSDVGMDTVINDVGSSSFVFRFGEKGSTGTRVNISGDGVKGSVTFDGSIEKQPITTLSANTEAIQTRCANLSNATGNEIIAAFETKQSGGFGGKTATFAIDAKSLGLTLKNGSAVYIAVYDSKTGKTYQNQGEVKDGVIIFKTKYSGVFMISREKF